MGILRDAADLLFGRRASPALVRQADALSQQLYGKPVSDEEARRLVLGLMPYSQPPKRGTRELLMLYAASPWLRAVVGSLASRVRATEWRLYAVQPQALRDAPIGQRSVRLRPLQRHLDHRRRRAVLRELAAREELQEVTVHPLLDLLDGGNLLLDGPTCLEVGQMHLDLKGETFWMLSRDDNGLPSATWPLPPHWVLDVPVPGRDFFRVAFNGWAGTIPSSEILWMKDVDPALPYGRGVGRGESLSDELETDEYASKHIKSWFWNGALPSAIVSMNGPNSSPEEAERIKADWENRYQGFWKAFRVHFTSSEVDVKQLSQTFADQQLIELRGAQRDAIIEAYAYPKELLGHLENANRSTIDTAAYRLEQYGVEPRREAWRRRLQVLAEEWDDRLVLDYRSTVPEDREFQLKVFQARPSAFSQNETRELAGLEPLPGNEGEERPPLVQAPTGFGLGDLGQLAQDPEWARTVRQVAKAEPRPGTQLPLQLDVPGLLKTLDPTLIEAPFAEAMEPELRDFIQESLEELGVEVRFDLLNPKLSELVRTEAAKKVRRINATTRDYVRGALEEGIAKGEGVADLAKRLREVPGFTPSSERATTIARTETTAAANKGQLLAWKESGVIERKGWLATADEKTRDTHRELNGEVVDLASSWESDGHRATHPGGFGVPEEDVNCRCTMVPVIEDPDGKSLLTKDLDVSAARWKRMAARWFDPWERSIARAVQRGLDAQREALLGALRKQVG